MTLRFFPSRWLLAATLLVVSTLPAVATPFGSGLPDEAGDEVSDDAVRTADIDLELLSALSWRTIGPAVMGGRIADLAAVDGDTFYAGAVTGNLWKTTNRGTTWEVFFDNEDVNSIGDVTIAPSNPNIVWIGTGEANNRQSSPWGAGVYKSIDGGRTWKHKGLSDSRHIGHIVIHPTDPDVVVVAAGGNLWAPSEERGVFRSLDGGDSWEKVLYVDENTGATDLAMAPGDPDTLIAAMYQRRRSACCFVGGGPGSGLYRSSDGGGTWEELTEGLPAGDKGRIGVDFFHRNSNVVFAVVEARRVSADVREAGDETPGAGVYRSLDRGSTWEQMSDTNPRPMYFSQIRVDPNDVQRIYVLGAQLFVSEDGGRTFRNDGARNVHSDFHAMWIDPSDSGHLILAGDGGVAVSFDRSDTWRVLDNLPVAQFYEIGVDMRDPYWVYGGLQDNGSWGAPSATRDVRGIRNADWINVNGGDGFFTRVDPNDPTIMFAESQNGNITRINLAAMERQSVRPVPRQVDGESSESEDEEGEGDGEPDPYRWNWNSPITISQHDSSTIYAAGNVLLRSNDRGYTWREISPDLTKAIDRDEEEIMGSTAGPGTLSRHDAPNPSTGALLRYYLPADLVAEDNEDVTDAADAENADGDEGGRGGESEARPPEGRPGGGGPGRGPRSTDDEDGHGEASITVELTIEDADGNVVRTLEGSGRAGVHEVVWDLRLAPPYEAEPPAGGGGRFNRTPQGPRVMPGTYRARLVAGSEPLQPVSVTLDPRVEVNEADLAVRQQAMMDGYELARPQSEAGRAATRLREQLDSVKALVDGREAVDEAIDEAIKTIDEELVDVQAELQTLRRGAFAIFGIERSTTRPTDDQLYTLERAKENLGPVIERVNALITDHMPALYRLLDEHGIRPDPGQPISYGEGQNR